MKPEILQSGLLTDLSAHLSSQEPFHKAAPMTMTALLPSRDHSRERGKQSLPKAGSLSLPAHSNCQSKSLFSTASTQVRGLRPPPLEGKSIKEFVGLFFDHHGFQWCLVRSIGSHSLLLSLSSSFFLRQVIQSRLILNLLCS